MKIKFGSFIVDGSGKINGHVASRNRGGAYLRTKVSPINPQSPFQSAVRSLLAVLSSGWAALTEAQRLLWNNAVDAYKRTDVFGDLRRPSGKNLYVSLNTNLTNAGGDLLTAPPLPQSVPGIGAATLAAANGGAVTLTFDEDPDVTDSVVLVYATPALSPGKTYVKSQFRFLGIMPAPVANVATITTLYTDRFEAVGEGDQKIFVQLKQVSLTSGQAGVPVTFSCIIT